MRRTDREIHETKKIEEILNKAQFISVGFNDEKGPYVVPFNYGYEFKNNHLQFYLHGACEGKKVDCLKKDNQVGFEIVASTSIMEPKGKQACSASAYYESILGKGTIEIVEENKKQEYLEKIMNHYGYYEYFFNENALKRVCVYKIDVLNYSGKNHAI